MKGLIEINWKSTLSTSLFTLQQGTLQMVLPFASLFIWLYWHIDNWQRVERTGEKGGTRRPFLYEAARKEKDILSFTAGCQNILQDGKLM